MGGCNACRTTNVRAPIDSRHGTLGEVLLEGKEGCNEGGFNWLRQSGPPGDETPSQPQQLRYSTIASIDAIDAIDVL